ncbi:hypothetical protein D3C73_1454550 [compost metagenome]
MHFIILKLFKSVTYRHKKASDEQKRTTGNFFPGVLLLLSLFVRNDELKLTVHLIRTEISREDEMITFA